MKLTNAHLGLKRTKSDPHPESRIIALLSVKRAAVGEVVALSDGVIHRRLTTTHRDFNCDWALSAFIAAECPFVKASQRNELRSLTSTASYL